SPRRSIDLQAVRGWVANLRQSFFAPVDRHAADCDPGCRAAPRSIRPTPHRATAECAAPPSAYSRGQLRAANLPPRDRPNGHTPLVAYRFQQRMPGGPETRDDALSNSERRSLHYRTDKHELARRWEEVPNARARRCAADADHRAGDDVVA